MTTVDVNDGVDLQYKALAAGVPTAATVLLTVTDPAGNQTTPAITFSTPNVYDASFQATTVGPWSWRWDVTGTVTDTEYGSVLAAVAAPPLYAPLSALRWNLNVDPSDLTVNEEYTQKLDAASRAVEKYCDGRRFDLAPVATQRVFSTGRKVVREEDGTERLQVDDIGTEDITVEVGDGTSWTAVSTVETYPDNALEKQDAVTALRCLGGEWSRNRRVRVTARWGWPAVPSAVYEATLLTAMRLVKRKASPEGVAGSPDWGLVRVPNLDPDVKAQLEHLTTRTFKAR